MSIVDYVRDTRAELKHVSWPTKKQAIIFTALVIVISIATALYLGLFDILFTRILEAVIS